MAWFAACASGAALAQPPTSGRAGAPGAAEAVALLQHTAIAGADVVLRALALLGVPYRYGGDDPARGLDCSGLVRRVYGDLLDLDLPHRAALLVREGRAVARAELAAGDLLFFDTRRGRDSHVAIYIGDGRFVHAPGRGAMVRVDVLDDAYWLRHFAGARRLLDSPS